MASPQYLPDLSHHQQGIQRGGADTADRESPVAAGSAEGWGTSTRESSHPEGLGAGLIDRKETPQMSKISTHTQTQRMTNSVLGYKIGTTDATKSSCGPVAPDRASSAPQSPPGPDTPRTPIARLLHSVRVASSCSSRTRAGRRRRRAAPAHVSERALIRSGRCGDCKSVGPHGSNESGAACASGARRVSARAASRGAARAGSGASGGGEGWGHETHPLAVDTHGGLRGGRAVQALHVHPRLSCGGGGGQVGGDATTHGVAAVVMVVAAAVARATS